MKIIFGFFCSINTIKTMSMLTPAQIFPKSLSAALKARGQYVYAYYELGCFVPFYVGKGSGTRALAHWNTALRKPTKEHEKRIVEILNRGEWPHISLLAYNLESSEEDRHSIAERVLQDAFGIQAVIEKTPGGERLSTRKGILLQKREDSASRRPLSLEAVVAMHSQEKAWQRSDLIKLAENKSVSILLVGLMNTYCSTYQDCHLREMARMYWNLDKFKNTSLKRLLSEKSILIAWSSKLTNSPVIVGTWRIDGSKAKYHEDSARYEFPANDDFDLRQELLGRRLDGNGNNWQGPNIFAPTAPAA